MSAVANAVCRSCGHLEEIPVRTSVNISDSPELKQAVLSGELFVWKCPECGASNLMKFPFLYHDPENRLILVLTDAPVNAEALPEAYTGRLVGTAGELIEKVKIFDAGFDDTVIELCKFVTCNELGRKVDLRFVRRDDSEGVLLFTYPENREMQLLSVGLNVYEDCLAIERRNPAIGESACGLVRVDSAWLADFVG